MCRFLKQLGGFWFGAWVVTFLMIQTLAAQVEINRTHQGRSIKTTNNVVMGDRLGRAVVGGVDFDGDGVLDYAALAQRDIFGGGIINGAIRVYSGATGSEIIAFHPAPPPGDFLGSYLAALDIDGDGRGELAVEIRSFNAQDRIEVYSFAPLRLRYTIANPNGTASSNFPNSVAAIPDLTGDGRPDIVAGDGYPSEFYVFSGADGSLFRRIAAPSAQPELFAVQSGGVGDINGDGIADIGVASTLGLYLYSGYHVATDPLHSLYSFLYDNTPGIRFAESFIGVGDLNGDGRGEMAVGSPGNAGVTGFVEILSFNAARQLTILRTLTDGTESKFGSTLTSVRDVTGDGRRELAVSTNHLDFNPNTTTSPPGHVKLFSLGNGEFLRTFGPSARAADLFGSGLATAGDINNDGIDEIIVGCSRDTGGNSPSEFEGNPTFDDLEAGAAYVFSAAPVARFPVPTATPTPMPSSGSGGTTPTPVPTVSQSPLDRLATARNFAGAIVAAKSLASAKKVFKQLSAYLKNQLQGAGARSTGADKLKAAQKTIQSFKTARATLKSYQKLGKKIKSRL